MGRATAIVFGPAPWGPGRGQKVKYHSISITKSILKIFFTNFVYVLANEDTKRIRRDFTSVKILIPHFLCALTNERYKTYKA